MIHIFPCEFVFACVFDNIQYQRQWILNDLLFHDLVTYPEIEPIARVRNTAIINTATEGIRRYFETVGIIGLPY